MESFNDGLSDEIDKDFDLAIAYVKGVAGSLQESCLLELYGYYKQATEGPCTTPKPGFWDFKGSKKWSAWKKLENISKEEAQSQYTDVVRRINPEFQSAKTKPWVSVSCIRNDEIILSETDKNIFDFCKENNLAALKEALSVVDVNVTDESGLSLIHWASDRNSIEVLRFLLERGADVDKRDEDGQSPLHYAALCDNVECLKILLEFGADVNVKDSEGLTPRAVASERIKMATLL
ncbi:acyl-CoA-binding domain-containing protein 6-like [Artemia franciscana]|uniref:Acyl-CoA-binding domain-containing protein 6 n=1 Tax=Artemia franciscana TaxID=6661 RepID=A0AA88KV17_ARTSF|nr:hypothetical protein QYM36_018181 [Artemia franciscana]